MDYSRSTCPICGQTGSEPLHLFAGQEGEAPDFAVLRCGGCDHRYTFPEPDEQLLDRLYRSGSFLENLASIIVEAMDQVSQEAQWSIVQEFSEPSRLLDIGCGAGTFLSGAKERGYEGFGLEKCAEFVDFARSKLRLDVKQGESDSGEYPPEFADVVTLWDVLEHLREPVQCLGSIRSLMKPGAILFMAFPNCDSIEAERFGAHWAGWWVPLHLHHFTPEVMTQLLESHGFTIVEAIYRQEYHVTAMSIRRLLGQDTSDLGAFVGRDERRGYLARAVVRLIPSLSRFIEKRALHWSVDVDHTWPEPEELSYMTFVATKKPE